MPCTSDGYDLPPMPTVSKASYDKLLEEHDKTTRILCEVSKHLTLEQKMEDITDEAREWILDHDKADKKRLKQDAVKKAREELAKAEEALAQAEKE